MPLSLVFYESGQIPKLCSHLAHNYALKTQLTSKMSGCMSTASMCLLCTAVEVAYRNEKSGGKQEKIVKKKKKRGGGALSVFWGMKTRGFCNCN